MSTTPLRRHDLVWLDPAVDAGRFVAAEHIDCTRNWVKQGWPLVVARQSEAATTDRLILGFTPQSAPVRKRITLRTPRAAIVRHSRPLLLLDAIEYAPRSWRAGIYRLHALCIKFGVVPHVYGSLSSQAFTGTSFLNVASDLDLLSVGTICWVRATDLLLGRDFNAPVRILGIDLDESGEIGLVAEAVR